MPKKFTIEDVEKEIDEILTQPTERPDIMTSLLEKVRDTQPPRLPQLKKPKLPRI